MWGCDSAGAIGTGKSQAARAFEEAGLEVIDLDTLAKQAVARGTPGYFLIRRRFPDALRQDGSLDRKRLGEVAFRDMRAKKFLERATHPFVALLLAWHLLLAWLRHRPCVSIEAALLFETKLSRLCWRTVATWCPQETQACRVAHRDGVDIGSARSKVGAQRSAAWKAEQAADVIDTSSSLEKTWWSAFSLAQRALPFQWADCLLSPTSLLALAGCLFTVTFLR